MTTNWTPEAVLALAPDLSSAKSAQGLAARQWSLLGRSETALWGEISGSGANPYQTRIDLTEPAFKCSCPSRKFPCKHGLALLLVFAREPKAFDASTMPPWVGDWLAERGKRADKRAEKAQADAVVDVEARERRIAQRETRIPAGLQELATWLQDLLRLGLAHAQTQPTTFWEGMAARLVDAQAPGLARLTRELEACIHTGPGWEARLLHAVGRIELVRNAYLAGTALPTELREEARAALGWTWSQDEVLAGAAVRDTWLVLGMELEADDRLRVRRIWLHCQSSGRPALLLDFAAGTQTLDPGLPVGAAVEAELVFYPGRLGLRAALKSQGAIRPAAQALPGHSIEAALTAYADVLARTPWVERWPMTLHGVRMQVRGHESGAPRWSVVDETQGEVALSPQLAHGWHLAAVSGGAPIDIFGEWDGERLRPLSAGVGTALYTLGSAFTPVRFT